MPRPLKVAVVGAGPAGIYASDILAKSDLDTSIDLFERLPAPYGLVRYGVAPDHPRIKQIIVALYRILQRGDIRLFANVEVGRDISIEEMRERYDAIIISTGADRDAKLDIKGVDLPQSYGAADFVAWYDGHPDFPRTWPLEAERVAVIGAGNVALDVARVLAKHMPEMIATDVPANVAAQLAKNPVKEVHLFGRRGPAQVKFTPLELRELGHVADVDIIVSEEDFDFDEGSQRALKSSNQQRQVVKTLTSYASADPDDHKASRRIYLHMFEAPEEILADEDGNVRALVTERTELVGDGNVKGTGKLTEWPVEAVYRAVGYFSSPVPGVPFDETRGVVPNEGGRVVEDASSDRVVPGLYATGWIKRGPVGLIGSTKSDARETITHLVEDAEAGRLPEPTEGPVEELLRARGVIFTDWQGWELLDAYEQELGENWGELPSGGTRERIKVSSREQMMGISRGEVTETAPVATGDDWEDDIHVGTPGELGSPTAQERFKDYSGPLES
ncbi:FAD-dependent oxidoreductase [Actinomyces minihominis]|uniref:FAD-dependent oxidoreductase n=1 Tax=Actinomyces minihominis TaxID=2002838 RepID=UPI000C07BC53|nr:FAD-dependent oxidoreductase [Actinomyces minihominis]